MAKNVEASPEEKAQLENPLPCGCKPPFTLCEEGVRLFQEEQERSEELLAVTNCGPELTAAKHKWLSAFRAYNEHIRFTPKHYGPPTEYWPKHS